MSDLLSGLGLQSVDSNNNPVAAPAPPAAPAAPAPVAAPPAAPVELPPLELPPAADEPVVVPEGARNPDAVQNAIQAERARAREAYARARALEQQLNAEREAALPLEDRLSSANQRAEEAERRIMRLEVGIKHNLPSELADRLRGSTREELEADVTSFLTHLKSPTPTVVAPADGAGGGYQPQPAVQADPQKAHNDWLGGVIRNQRRGA